VAEEFAARVTEQVEALRVGRGTEEGVQIGPLINTDAVRKNTDLVSEAVNRGARLRTGGSALEGPGTFFQPTVVTDVRPGSRILAEEIFGPVVSMVTFAEEAEGVAMANDTEYGLVGYAYTRDLARSQRLIESLQTGMMGLNVGVISNAAAPFGGIKQSGIGREGGFEGIDEFLYTKYTMTPDPYA
jgi:succinate-semialdehyde dehydrogenase/glutarate-semialdehyde dehydrogenase